MNQLGQSCIILILLYDVFSNMSLYIGAKFFRSETP